MIQMNPLARLVEKSLMLPGRQMKESQFELLHPRGGHILFLGDSITEGGAWQEWFPKQQVLNRGIGSDTSAGVLNRLEVALRGDPSKVFLLIGTNDLGLGVGRETVLQNVSRIVDRIVGHTTATDLVLQSVMPRHARYASRIRALNASYRELADDAGATFLDLWPTLSDNRGGLLEQFTRDNLHLNGAGYEAWVSVLSPLIVRREENISG
ncbi:SGNH/GDSL hydrolase family protein [Leifsonia kafniensis]|uniref:SGNH/GDSL hydrolase family protein n=1 Tax=Leifsonia kafniensis TaxID=475957 RepID=A0ABP7JZS7_9MICO